MTSIIKTSNLSNFCHKTSSGIDHQTRLKKHTIIFKRCILTFTILLSQKEIEIKIKNINTPWMTKGFREYSKRKQYLHEKLMKMQIAQNEKT